MRLVSALSAAAALCLLANPIVAAANEEPKEAQASGGEEKKAKPKKICKQIANTGFRTAARKCKTQAEWDAEEAQGVTDMDIRAKGNY